MSHKIPRTPFSTALSGSARETELRLKNIFSGPKKRPPALFLAAVFAVCIFCGNLVSCNVAGEEPDPPGASQPEEISRTEPEEVSEPEPEALKFTPASELSFDINQNGIPEELRLESAYGRGEVQFYENGELIDREQPGVCVYSYPLGGPDHILRYYDYSEYPGSYFYSYSISDFSGEFEEIIKSNSVSFDLNFNAPFHTGFDPAAIATYAGELNELFDHSCRLSEWDGELVAEFPENILPRMSESPDIFSWEVTLPWLDQFPEVFTQNPDKSLEENLRDFQTAMTAAYPAPEPLGTVDALPFDQPLSTIFASGAGAWCTGLDLSPDGTFTADYHDADMDVQYVCQFHGRFGDFVQLTENSWSLTLEELVLDTKYPVGKEWDEVPDWFDGPIHFISSEPYGFTDEEGKALRPGAQFILYSPQARGYAPGTELYGAYEFWTWNSDRHGWGPDTTMDCWGLQNLTSRIGFFANA